MARELTVEPMCALPTSETWQDPCEGMPIMNNHSPLFTLLVVAATATIASAQLSDVTQTPNAANVGIQKSLTEQIGAGAGSVMIPGSSRFLIARDPARSIVRGRQIFQRKFTSAQGHGPRTGDGEGNIELDASIVAGLSDSCAGCHARPFGSAGFGGDVFTRPDSRDAPHLFGLGLQEMLADEITGDLRAIRDDAIAAAVQGGSTVTATLESKGILYGHITAQPDGSVDTSGVVGVNPDLRVRPFFAEGSTISIREFLVGAFNAEMGLEAPDGLLLRASLGREDVTTPAGMRLTGSVDQIEAPPAMSTTDDPDGDGVTNEIDMALVDHMEFYLLNYFRPGLGRQGDQEEDGLELFGEIGCADCHIPDLLIERDRRVADTSTVYDPDHSTGYFGSLYTTATVRFTEIADRSGFPSLKVPNRNPFLVEDIYTDFKRHDLGKEFHERNFDGSVTTEFITEPLWGVGSTPPYGHDGRSPTLESVILRHGGEASRSRQAFMDLSDDERDDVLAFLRSLVLFAPPDTPSNLEPMDPSHPDFPLAGHGAVNLSVLFNDPTDKE